MSARAAHRVENAIIACASPPSSSSSSPSAKLLSGIGMGLVVLGGLAFNLVPLCEPGRPARNLIRAAVVVVVVFVAVLAVALLSAHLYGEWLRAQRPA